MNTWNWVAVFPNLELLRKIWEWAEEKLTTVEINNKFLLGADSEERSAWHWAAVFRNLELLHKIWERAEG